MNPLSLNLSTFSDESESSSTNPFREGQKKLYRLNLPNSIDSLSSMGTSLATIGHTALQQVQTTREASQQRFSSTLAIQTRVGQELQSISDKINNSRLGSTTTDVPKMDFKLSAQNLMALCSQTSKRTSVGQPDKPRVPSSRLLEIYDKFREERLRERMAIARVAATAVGGIEAVVSAPLQFAVSQLNNAASSLCGINDTTKRTCRKARKIVGDASQPIYPLLENILTAIDSATKIETRAWQREFGFSDAMVNQFQSDLLQVIPFALFSLRSAFGRPVQRIINRCRQSVLPTVGTTQNGRLANDLTAAQYHSLIPLNSRGDLIRPRLQRASASLPEIPCSFAITQYFGDLSFIPNIKFFGSREMTWLSALGLASSPTPPIHYFRSGHKSVAKLGREPNLWVIKDSDCPFEIINELHGIEFARSLQLCHVDIPRLATIGQYNDERYFIAKSYLPGLSLEEMMQVIGRKSDRNQKRPKLFSEFLLASEALGNAVGEVQAYRRHLNPRPPVQLFDLSVGQMENSILELNRLLKNQGIRSSFTFDSPGIQELIKHFKSSPFEQTFGFGDISGGQFVWSSERRLAYIDSEMLGGSISTLGNPLASAAHEYNQFIRLFHSEGLINGLNDLEIYHATAKFNKGFVLQNPATFSKASGRFFRTYSSIQTLVDIIEFGLLEEECLQNYLKNINLQLELERFSL